MKISDKLPLIVITLLAIVVVLSPVFVHDTWTSYDSAAHYGRLKAINNQVANLQFPPLFDYLSPGSFGYSWNMFYPPLSVYIMMLVKLLSFGTLSDVVQFKLSVGAMVLIGFASMYYAAKEIFASRECAMYSAVLFVTSGYFLSNAYVRVDVGELMAMSFIPLLALGLRSLLTGGKHHAFFPFAVALILLSNIPSFIASLIFITLVLVMHLKITFTRSVMLYMLKSVVYVLLATAFFTVPLVYHSMHYDVFAFNHLGYHYETMGKLSADLPEIVFGMMSAKGNITPGILISAGVVVNAIVIAGLLKRNAITTHTPQNIDIKLLLIALVFIPAATNIFPWYIIPNSVPFFRFMQFPWRLIMISTPILCLYAGSMLFKSFNNVRVLRYFILVFAVIMAFYPLRVPLTERVKEIPLNVFNDYMTTKFEKNKGTLTKEEMQVEILSGEGSVNLSGYTLGYPVYQYKITSDSALVELPIMAYKGYNVEVNGQSVEYGDGDRGLMTVNIAQGSGNVAVEYKKSLTLIPFIVSILFILIMLISIVKPRKRK
ncbi:hypothetical protein [Edaphovirga cremea]|uniref:hypothetical protein n=1 Tax=Edaphovirga cremea TaxID=2267246 RepID=UPI000DEEE092|nr:hypothetical protein [Edaphovirga cremea]